MSRPVTSVRPVLRVKQSVKSERHRQRIQEEHSRRHRPVSSGAVVSINTGAPRSVQRRESQARARSHGYTGGHTTGHQSLTMISDMTSNMDDMWEDPVLGSPLMMTRSDVPLMLSQSRHNMMIGLGALGRESSVDSPKNSLIRSV